MLFSCISLQVLWYFHLYEDCYFFLYSNNLSSALFVHNQQLCCAASIVPEGSPTSSPDIYVVLIRLKTSIKNLDSAWCRLTCQTWILKQYHIISTTTLLPTPTKCNENQNVFLINCIKTVLIILLKIQIRCCRNRDMTILVGIWLCLHHTITGYSSLLHVHHFLMN